MSDNVNVTPGTGTSIAADEVVDATLGTVKVQYVKLMDGTLDGTTKAGVGSNGLKVDGSAVTQPVSGTVTSNAGTGTFNNQQTNVQADYDTTGGTQNLTMFGIAVPGTSGAKAGGTLTDPIRVDPVGSTTQPVSVSNFPATQAVNMTQVGSNAISTNTGTRDSGTLRVTVATNDSVPVTGTFWPGTQPVSGTVTANAGTGPFPVSDNAGSLTVDGTVTANAGTGTFTNQQTNITADYDTGAGTQTLTMFGVALPKSGGAVAGGTSSDPLRTDPTGTTPQPVTGTFWQATQPVSGTVTTTPPTNASTNIAQMNGITVSMNTGVRDTGTQRVTIATNDSVPVTGTFWQATQPVSSAPATTGGLTIFEVVSAASTNATNIKASAGQVYGYYILNTNAAVRYVKFHNTAGSPTAGSGVVMALGIPASSAANVEFSNGIAFATGIAITTVTGIANTDAVAVAANDLLINIFYK